MKIVRDGKEFELTRDELYNAYLEQQNAFDISSVKNNLEVYLDEEEYDILKDNQDFIEAVADEMRRQINKYDVNFEFAMEEAFNETKEEYLTPSLLNQFKEYCYKMADEAAKRYDKQYEDRYMIYDGMWGSDAHECDMYSRTAEFLIDEYPEMFEDCKTIEECEEVAKEDYDLHCVGMYLEDERGNLSYGDAELNGVTILEVGSIGRWNGTSYGVNILEPKNIGELLTSNCEQWICYVDKESGDFYKSEFHHDGSNHYEYRELTCDKYEFEDMLDAAKPGDMDALVEKYSKPIGYRVASVYGWDLGNKSVDERIQDAKGECEVVNMTTITKTCQNELEH